MTASCAPVPQPCPDRAHGHSGSSVPTCPLSLDRGTGTAHFEGKRTRPSVPNERRRLYRRPTPPTSAPIRRGRLRRVQAEKVTPHRADGFVAFNDGNEASVMRGPILDGLRLAERNGSMMDVDLADYGNGWMVERILPASDAWKALEVLR
jgi:hypothetical protein